MAEKNQKKNGILQSANVLFMEKGFHNTKMEEIAVNAGVGKGTLYEYFKNKQDIIDEVCIEKIAAAREMIIEISNKEITFKQKLAEIFKYKRELMHCEDMSIESILAYKNAISDDAIKIMMNHVTEMYDFMFKMIEQGKDEGIVTKSLPSEIIACAVVGTMSEYFRLHLYNDGGINGDDDIFNLFFNGFGVK